MNRDPSKALTATQKPKLPSPRSKCSATQNQEVQRLANFIVETQGDIDHLLLGSLARAIEVGRALVKAKSILGHGNYSSWVSESLGPRCGISIRTAQRYVKLANSERDLVERVAAHYESLESIDAQEVNELFDAMRISDAMKFLALPKAFPPSKSLDPPNDQASDNDSAEAALLKKLTEQFLNRIDDQR